MGNSLRCCLACVIPCGALDLVRIVHLNGQVEEITRPITAGEVLNNNPNHFLSTPCSQGVVNKNKILILSSESKLKRGCIYFLIPESSLLEKKKRQSQTCHKKSLLIKRQINCQNKIDLATVECSSEKKSYRRHRRSSTGGASAIWKPHLDSIIEDQ
ncbi:hypothetical protein LIER_42686 [Lithospermum erythrorhizon]|uniref:Uncharacterized protein n=1 Tax=Lithospermum erythrorhizon TaxID=34254 RepID=A0AAV3NSI3_LITER